MHNPVQEAPRQQRPEDDEAPAEITCEVITVDDSSSSDGYDDFEELATPPKMTESEKKQLDQQLDAFISTGGTMRQESMQNMVSAQTQTDPENEQSISPTIQTEGAAKTNVQQPGAAKTDVQQLEAANTDEQQPGEDHQADICPYLHTMLVQGLPFVSGHLTKLLLAPQPQSDLLHLATWKAEYTFTANLMLDRQ